MFSDGPSLNTSLIIIAAYLLLTLGIGLYAARSVKTLADYILAGRTDRQYLRMTRYVVAVFAVFSMLLALTEIGIHDLVEIASAITLVSVVVPLTAGLYWKRATRRGAIWAMASGLSVYLLLSLLSLYQSTQGIGMQDGQPLSDWAGYAWLVDASGSADLGWFLPPSMMGLFTSIIAMAIGSLWPRKRG